MTQRGQSVDPADQLVGLFFLGQVADNDHCPDQGGLVVAQQRGGHAQRGCAVVGVDFLAVDHGVIVQGQVDDVGNLLVKDHRRFFPQHLLAFEAEHLFGAPVDGRYFLAQVEGNDAVGRAFQDVFPQIALGHHLAVEPDVFNQAGAVAGKDHQQLEVVLGKGA